jgi:hypothetical protein
LLRAWFLVIVGVAGLVSMRVAYNLTYEQAPAVRVRWRDGTDDWRRAWLERKYRLIGAEAPMGLSYSYVLMDTSRGNIETMIKDPEVADTNDIDRRKFEVPWETAYYTQTTTWAADRIPGLRQPPVRWGLIAGLVAMILAGSARIVRAVKWADRRDAVLAWLRRMESALKNG